MYPRAVLVPEQRADAADGLEVSPLADDVHRAAVGEGLVDGEVETVIASLERRPVERTTAVGHLCAATGRALVGPLVGAVADEQHVHAPVRRGLQRLLPAGRRAAVLAGLLAPALEQLLFPSRPPLREHGTHRLEELRRVRVRLGGPPADDARLHLVGEDGLEVGADVLGPDEDDAGAAELAHARLERLGHAPEVLADDVLDVALVVRLRPAALVVPARSLLGPVGELDELPRAEVVDLAALTAHERDEDTLATADEPGEGREIQLGADLHLVLERLRDGDGAPEVVERGREDGEAADAVAVEVVVEPAADPLDVRLQRLARRVPKRALAPGELAFRLGEQRLHLRLRVAGGRDVPWIEIQVNADRAAVLGAESGQLPELVPGDRPCHVHVSACPRRAILFIRYRRARLHRRARHPPTRGARRDAPPSARHPARRRPPLSELAPQSAVRPRRAAGGRRDGGNRVSARGRARRPPQRRAG